MQSAVKLGEESWGERLGFSSQVGVKKAYVKASAGTVSDALPPTSRERSPHQDASSKRGIARGMMGCHPGT